MAIKALAWMVRVFEPPVYCYHEIVHNQVVVDRFRQLGVVFVDDVSEVPAGRPLMLSAHGSAPEVVAAARANGGTVVDAVCPLVTKVHHEVKLRASKGYSIVYVGHEGHEEAVGTIAVAPDAIHRVESVAELMALPEPEGPVAFLAQTTLALDEWRNILEAAQERWPDLWVPGRSDLCFATTNRQAALRAIAARCDTMVVIGSANSSNTLALVRTARSAGCARACASTPPPSSPTTCPAWSASSPGHPRPSPWWRRSYAASPPSRGQKRSGPCRRTSTSPSPESCARCCGASPPLSTRSPSPRRRRGRRRPLRLRWTVVTCLRPRSWPPWDEPATSKDQ